jgi:thymidylate synthase
MGSNGFFETKISEGILPDWAKNVGEKQYLDLMTKIKKSGFIHSDRTGAGRCSLFGETLRFSMRDGFPLITTRKIFTKALVHELLWFISGSMDNTELNDCGVHIWDKWAIGEVDADSFDSEEEYLKNKGSIGRIYGPSWRNAPGRIDQLGNLIYNLKTNPYSSRHVISAWIPQWIPHESLSFVDNIKLGKGALAPCHVLQQYFVKKDPDGTLKLSLLMYQRSADVPVGLPYNIAQYSLLLHMVAQVVGMVADEFIWSGGDTHIYLNQLGKVDEQTSRTPYAFPKLILNKDIKSIFNFKYDDIEIKDYVSHPAISYPVNV